MSNERREIPVRIKGCPLGLEGQAWLISNSYTVHTVSYEHCYDGDALLSHHLSKTGNYIKTEGCEGCKLKNGKKAV